MRILFVENHVRFARITRLHFLSDHEVAVVPSLNAAREQLQNSSFDIVLLDFDLDDGKGVELFAVIENLAVRPYVVAISSHADGNALLKKAGADEICPKNEFHKIEFVLRSFAASAS